MNPEVFLVFRQFIFNRKTVVTDVNEFIEENTLNRAFTLEDYSKYFQTYLCLQLVVLVSFVLWHIYRLVNRLLKFISPKIQIIYQ